ARGYHNQPHLTATRFIAHPHHPGRRLYRTGDLVRQHPDGTLEYAGRNDHQIKIRGHRVETGEIETALLAHPGVAQAAVTVREDQPGTKHLVGYVVATAELPDAELRVHLAATLPEYMVPSAFVTLDALPLNAAGKLDRTALPAPHFDTHHTAYTAPRTETEHLLADIWREILGAERVGVDDNFFDLGGDSIISLQVVSRARRAGLSLTSRDVFLNPTVAALALASQPSEEAAETLAEQGTLTGPVPALPARAWFFETHPVAPEHFNLSVAVALAPEYDEDALRAAVAAVVDHHDALRLTFDTAPDSGPTAAYRSALHADEVLETHELTAPADPADPAATPDARWRAAVLAAHSGFDLARGPLVRFVVGRQGAGRPARLALVAHHLVMDGVSLRVLMEDLATAYEQVAAGGRAELGPKGTSVRQWAERLAAHTAAGGFDDQIPYWRAVADEAVAELPVDFPEGGNTVASQAAVSIALTADQTEALLQQASSLYRTQANDVLLTALARALRSWTGHDRVAVTLEGHGREELFADTDLTRTVGWFTSLHPIALALPEPGDDPDGDWPTAVKSVKEQLRAIPQRGIGHGALRHLADAPVGRLDPLVSFNYHGQFDVSGDGAEGGLFREALPGEGGDHAPAERRAHLLDVVGAVQDGRLVFSWFYSADTYREATVRGVAEGFAAELAAFAEHCARPDAGGCTPSDFPLVTLGQAEVDQIAGDGRAVEDIYPLTPLQSGMLFHALADPESGAYLEQLTFTLEGVGDVERLATAWQRVLGRADALRVSLAWEGVPEPVQVVHRRMEAPVRIADWSAAAEAERDLLLADFLAEDRARGVDLAEGPLLRVTLIRLAPEEVQVVWTFHHLLLDGWSNAALLGDVVAEYAVLGTDPAAAAPAVRGSFGDYLRWLAAQDQEAGRAYWRRALAGFEEPVELPYDRAPGQARDSASSARVEVTLDPAAAARVSAFARRHRLTLNALVQGAWALVLGQQAGVSDVVFGTTVSGRPADLPGAESILGLFINTLPVRVQVDPARPAADWLGSLQAELAEARSHEYVALSDITADVAPGASLFESLVVFENYPVDKETTGRHGLGVRGMSAVETTNYPLTLVASAVGDHLDMVLSYDPGLFDAGTADRLAGRLRQAVTALADSDGLPVGRLPLLAEAEWRTVAEEWSGTVDPASGRSTVPAAFAARVAAAPDAVAVECDGVTLTYAALDARADRLARVLAEQGVTPGAESRVALLLERSADVVVAMLAVLKAGGAYVPLFAGYPDERIRQVVDGSGATVIVTDAALRERAVLAALPVVEVGAAPAGTAPAPGAGRPDSLAYVMFTSGSTGVPKGVAITHADIVALAADGRFANGAHERVLFHSPHSFDAATYEVWVPLLNGHTLTVATEDLTTATIRQAVADGVTALWITAALFGVLVEEDPECFTGIREVWTGGDAVPHHAAHTLLTRHPGLTLVNGYGPTETTTFAVTGPLDAQDVATGPAPLGTPMDNTHAYLLDSALRPVPVGVPGELYLGGTGLARGYHSQPRLTAQRFVADPYHAGRRLYRTGDLARWRTDGRIDFLGRTDTQVKIRGYRIETSEIETALLAHPAVTQSCVLAREDRPGTKYLVAYVVLAADADGGPGQDGGTAAEALRAHLAENLPTYMVPAAFTAVAAIPLTVNGKVDRRALPAPDLAAGTGSAYTAPATPTEQALAGIWAEVLGAERVGAHDDFFALGGDSISSLKVTSRIRTALRTHLTPRALFDHPTVARLAAEIDAREDAVETAVTRAPRDGYLPLSFTQERLWFLENFTPGGVEYTITGALRLTGTVDLAALRAAVAGLVERHEALRTTFASVAGRGVQVVHDSVPVPVRAFSPGTPEELDALLRTEAAEPFDLMAGPLVRVLLAQVPGTGEGSGADEEHVLVLSMHHIVTDGWSMGVITRELSALYAAAVRGEDAGLPALPVQYPDFAVWQRERLNGEALDRQLAYWHRKLDGIEPLELPTDRPRPTVRTSAGAVHSFQVPPALADRLAKVAHASGASLFMVLTAVTQLVLSRYTGQRDVAVGTVVSGRERTELENLVGFFVNTLVLRSRIDATASFTELLDDVRTTTLDAFAHQDVPFSRLIEELAPERDTSRTPLVQALVALQNAPAGEFDLPGLRVAEQPMPREAAQFELSLHFQQTGGSGLAAIAEFNTDLFDAATVERLCRHWLTLAEEAVAAPSAPLAQLTMAEPAERAALRAAAGAGSEAAGPFRSVLAMVADQVARTPEAVALLHGGTTLTYAELGRRTDQLARHLIALGARPEKRIGISLPRTPDLVVAALAVLKTGAAYVPLDPEYPADRLQHMEADSGTHLTVDASVITAALAGASGPVAHPPVTPQNAAYVIYTSGSTGLPKGVVIPHHAMSRLVEWATTLGEDTFAHTFFSTSLNFDVSVFELFGTLASGGTLEIAHNILTLTDHPAWNGTLVSAVPSAFQALVTDPTTRLGPKLLVLAGEAFPTTLLTQARRALPRTTVANIYGPTEATVYATGWFSHENPDPHGTTVPIGRPLAGKSAYVLDSTLNPVPTGAWGELYLAGSLARGYHNQPHLTAHRFVAHPYQPGRRLYRTGDLVRQHVDGTLEYAGRNDHQIKIRGHRIETGEIETTLLAHPRLTHAAVVAREDQPGTKYLTAYLVTTGHQQADPADVRAHLARTLPDHMVPSAFVTLDALPLNAAGKLDRNALPAPRFEAADHVYTAPRTETERVLSEVWAEVLGLGQVGVEDDFFDLGGDSIISLQVVSRARRAGLVLTSRDVFLHPTITALAAAVDENGQVADDGGAQQGAVLGAVAPTPVREWFFATHPMDPGHYTMSTSFALPAGTDLGALRSAVEALLAQHDALRSTFTRTAEGGWSGRIAAAVEVDEVFAVHDLPFGAQEEAAWLELATRTKAGLDLERGPLLRVVVGRPAAPAGPGQPEPPLRLLVTAHHLVIDGVSWRIVLGDLAAAYEQALSVGATDLGPKSSSVRYWAERLGNHVQEGGFADQVEYWRSVTEAAEFAVPLDTPDGTNLVADQAAVQSRLDADETHALLHQVPGRFRTQINDVLLAALARTLREWTGHDRVAVNLEGHGREELFEDVDLTRTVGWFTSIYPVALTLPEPGDGGADADWPATMRSVKRQLRAVPERGVGYGALRYLSGELAGDPDPLISFNYLGQFGGGSGESGLLSTALPPAGPEHGLRQERNHLIDVVAAVDDGTFVVTWYYSAAVHRASTVTALADGFTAALRGVCQG
ncbi:amino acid adenylation domain-containing protein, partial [Streptomyces sp. NPDC058372]|uniref:amino acid adenylation domain-containing protein n=1 Tax=Streptomyces sp. NPDC058372 TaxID=3346464 RepID=UPI003663D245